MSYSFEIKELAVPLFGVVEVPAKREALWSAFAGPGRVRPYVLDDDALDLIASDLEQDTDGIAHQLWRYTRGKYREKTRGPGGDTLHASAEAITVLRARAQRKRIVRAVGSRAAPGTHQRPQPDSNSISSNFDFSGGPRCGMRPRRRRSCTGGTCPSPTADDRVRERRRA